MKGSKIAVPGDVDRLRSSPVGRSCLREYWEARLAAGHPTIKVTVPANAQSITICGDAVTVTFPHPDIPDVMCHSKTHFTDER